MKIVVDFRREIVYNVYSGDPTIWSRYMIVWFLVCLIISGDGKAVHQSQPFVSEAACKAALKDISPDVAKLAPQAYILECVPTHLLKVS